MNTVLFIAGISTLLRVGSDAQFDGTRINTPDPKRQLEARNEIIRGMGILERDLMNIVRERDKYKGKNRRLVVVTAIDLLGKLRSREAVELLIKIVGYEVDPIL